MKKLSLTNNQLKIIAVISMLLDHVGKELFPQYTILQIFGRVAFPIFSFMIAEGCLYTRDKKKYFLKNHLSFFVILHKTKVMLVLHYSMVQLLIFFPFYYFL